MHRVVRHAQRAQRSQQAGGVHRRQLEDERVLLGAQVDGERMPEVVGEDLRDVDAPGDGVNHRRSEDAKRVDVSALPR